MPSWISEPSPFFPCTPFGRSVSTPSPPLFHPQLLIFASSIYPLCALSHLQSLYLNLLRSFIFFPPQKDSKSRRPVFLVKRDPRSSSFGSQHTIDLLRDCQTIPSPSPFGFFPGESIPLVASAPLRYGRPLFAVAAQFPFSLQLATVRCDALPLFLKPRYVFLDYRLSMIRVFFAGLASVRPPTAASLRRRLQV